MCRNLSEFEPPQPCHGQPVSPVMALGVKEEGLRWDNSAIVLQQVCKATLTIQARTAELLRCFSSSLVMLLPAPKPSSCSACVVPQLGRDQNAHAKHVQKHTYVCGLWQFPS